MTARDLLSKQLADVAFPLREGGGKFYARVEEAVVDGPQLDADADRADLALRGPETGHARYHTRVAKLRRGNNIVKLRLVHEVPADAVKIDYSMHIKIRHELIYLVRHIANLIRYDRPKNPNLEQP